MWPWLPGSGSSLYIYRVYLLRHHPRADRQFIGAPAAGYFLIT